MLPIAMFLMQREGAFLSGHEAFINRIGAAYHAYIDTVEKACKVGVGQHARGTCMPGCLGG